jgi:hypothetical protein
MTEEEKEAMLVALEAKKKNALLNSGLGRTSRVSVTEANSKGFGGANVIRAGRGG